LDRLIHENGAREIILSCDICFEDYEIDFYEDGVELDLDNLSIDGRGHTIDGADQSRIFIVTGNNIKLKNLTFKNGHSHRNYDNPFNNSGGAIKINHNTKLTVENCNFINNNSEESGGAIYNFGELIVKESTFSNNVAHSMGGAIYNSNAVSSIADSRLNGNTAYGMGGAIYSNGEMAVRKSLIDENISQYGGAIRNDGKLRISRSKINKNTSTVTGGAIINGGELAIAESTIDENVSQYGGAICNEGQLAVIESILNGNTSNVMGGAIHNVNATLTIARSELNGNSANGKGGAIYNYGELEIAQSTLNNNRAKDGGAISLEKSAKHELNNCAFKDNEPNDVK
jgi:predicted outer membrane repeat protein